MVFKIGSQNGSPEFLNIANPSFLSPNVILNVIVKEQPGAG
jgi:hypothetical protein